jgi:hypothetical protein
MVYSNSHPVAEQRKDECLKFYPYNMSAASEQYVCWIDVMGSQETMLNSLYIASNFLMKLHMAALKVAEEFPVNLYPAIDGVYICSTSPRNMLSFLNRTYSALATTFIIETEERFKFKVRGGLAYGQVVMGNQVLNCAGILQKNQQHTKSVLLGSALTHAFRVEKEAPPFGIKLDKSVIDKIQEISSFNKCLKWWEVYARPLDRFLAYELYYSLKNHYIWCSANSEKIGYLKEAIGKHESLVDEYFSDFRNYRVHRLHDRLSIIRPDVTYLKRRPRY